MKTFKEYISEAKGVTHTALSKKISKMFDAHASGDDDFETVHVKKNAHTGASKHFTGSTKVHSLGYRPKKTGNAFSGSTRWDPNKKYADHPLHKDVADLIKKHGGTHLGSKNNGDRGGFIDTSDGYRHHLTSSLGSNFDSIEHQVHKSPVTEGTFKGHVSENVLGPNWKKISPAAYEKAKNLHTSHKNGKMFKGRLSDGSIHVQHWTQNASDAGPSVQKVNHKDGTESHWVKKAPINEMTDAEIDAHNDKFEKNVVDAHLKHIHKKYGKDADVNFGSGSTDSEFTSKVYHPKKGTIRVTTHFHPTTLKVEKHSEE